MTKEVDGETYEAVYVTFRGDWSVGIPDHTHTVYFPQEFLNNLRDLYGDDLDLFRGRLKDLFEQSYDVVLNVLFENDSILKEPE